MKDKIVSALGLVNSMPCHTNIKIDFYENGIKINEYKGKASISKELDKRLENKIVGMTDIVFEDGSVYISLNVYSTQIKC